MAETSYSKYKKEKKDTVTKKKKKSFFKVLSKKAKSGYKTASKVVAVGAKVGGKTLDVFDKITVGVEKANTGLYIGNKVKITNGPYSNKTLTITQFIQGGIKGRLSDGGIIQIRHGSYVKPEDKYPKYGNDQKEQAVFAGSPGKY